MGTLQDDTALSGTGEGRFTAELSRDWEIWGPNGGYLSAVALRAAGRAAPAGHRPATFSGQYLSSPRFGPVELEVTVAKPGRAAACLNVAMRQEGRTTLQAQVWTVARDTGPMQADAEPPAVPKPAELKPIWEHLPPGAPRHRFWSNFDMRPVRFIPPGGERDPRGARLEQWQRYLGFDAGGDLFLDAGRALLLVDTMPWPAFARAQAEPPAYVAPSLDLTVWFHDAPGAAEWLLLDAHADTASRGLIHGGARVWSEDGRLLATGGSQLLVVDPRT